MKSLQIARPRGVAASALTASAAIHVLSLAVPLALFQTYDRILPNKAYGTTFVLALGVFIAIVLEAVIRYTRAVFFSYVGSAFDAEGIVRLFEHVMRADGRALHALTMPSLTYSVRAIWEVRDFWSGNAAVAMYELPFAVVYLALIGYIGTWLVLVPLTLTLLAAVFAVLLSRYTAAAMEEAGAAQLVRRDLGWGIFLGLVEAKAMAAETMLTRRYHDAVVRAMEASVRVEVREAIAAENGFLLSQLATVGVVAAGAFMVVGGELTTGGLAACTLLAGRSIGPTLAAFGYFSRKNQRHEAEARIDKVMSLPLAPIWSGVDTSANHNFTGGPLLLSGEALPARFISIPQGAFVHVDADDPLIATSLLRTVARLDDWLGLYVTLDGEPVGNYDPISLKRGITKVSSQGELFCGSLLDNLTLFSPQFEPEAIQLSERLGLNTFVDGLHEGYLTPIGPGSEALVSPGVAARIGIIRAMVRRPLVLCLDQADNFLDLDGIKRLVDVLLELKGHTTVLIVSGSPMLIELASRQLRVELPRSRKQAAEPPPLPLAALAA